MSKIVKTWDGHQGELLYIKGKIAFIKESNGEVWYCLKTDIIDFDEINMEEYYVKDAGKITYVYGVNLEEHKTVIEKQQKRIAELEQELAELKEKAIVPKFKKGQKVWIIWDEYNEEQDCIIYEIYQKTIGFFNYINIDDVPFFEYAVLNNVKDNTVFGYINEPYIFLTEQEAQAKLKEIQGNE